MAKSSKLTRKRSKWFLRPEIWWNPNKIFNDKIKQNGKKLTKVRSKLSKKSFDLVSFSFWPFYIFFVFNTSFWISSSIWPYKPCLSFYLWFGLIDLFLTNYRTFGLIDRFLAFYRTSDLIDPYFQNNRTFGLIDQFSW